MLDSNLKKMRKITYCYVRMYEMTNRSYPKNWNRTTVHFIQLIIFWVYHMCGIGIWIETFSSSTEVDKEDENGRKGIVFVGNNVVAETNTSNYNGDEEVLLSVESLKAAVMTTTATKTEMKEELWERLKRRGPSAQDMITIDTDDTKTTLFGAVLHLRGPQITSQPVSLSNGSYFCYNGEVFDIYDEQHFYNSISSHITNDLQSSITTSTTTTTIHTTSLEANHHINHVSLLLKQFLDDMFPCKNENNNNDVDNKCPLYKDGKHWISDNSSMSDTEWLANSLNFILSYKFHDHKDNDDTIVSEDNNSNYGDEARDIMIKCWLEQIKGPFAFIHYCPKRQRLLTMRDILGRRSLCLTHDPTHKTIAIANVALNHASLELPCHGAIRFHINKKNVHFDTIPRTFPTDLFSSFLTSSPSQPQSSKQTNTSNTDNMIIDDDNNKDQDHDGSSEGHDVTVICEGMWSVKKMQTMAYYQGLFNSALYEAVKKRVWNQSHVSVLFSGGLDSTVLAALTAKAMLLQSSQQSSSSNDNTDHNDSFGKIQLINVTFDPIKGPDRHTCLLSYQNLLQQFPPNTFDLILVDLTLDDMKQQGHESHILQLLGPNHSHMDFNISTCLWYAARGKGYIFNNHKKTFVLSTLFQQAYVPLFKGAGGDKRKNIRVQKLYECFPSFQSYFANEMSHYFQPNDTTTTIKNNDNNNTSQNVGMIDPSVYTDDNSNDDCQVKCAPSSVLIMGHGADELLGGYGRHISAFEKSRYENKEDHHPLDALTKEMWKDCHRLWKRNLGRDDRVLSDWGKEARHPYLDEDFIEVVTTELPPLVDKLLLRQLAASEYSLTASRFEKRAIQFGTRLAKLNNQQKFSTNRQGKSKGLEKY